MLNYIKKQYISIKNKIADIKKAYEYKSQEVIPILEVYGRSNNEYLNTIKNHKTFERENRKLISDVRADVKKRYFDNIFRIFKNKPLHQDEEKELGIKYNNLGGHRFYARDKTRYTRAKEDLEYKINNRTYEKKEPEAANITTYKQDTFTNKIANISQKNEGVAKKIANALAGYVREGDELIAPHKREWSERICELENILIENNISKKDRDELENIKDALSKNNYLVKRKRKEYEKIQKMIEKAQGRDK